MQSRAVLGDWRPALRAACALRDKRQQQGRLQGGQGALRRGKDKEMGDEVVARAPGGDLQVPALCLVLV
jgi:hypothetical protein